MCCVQIVKELRVLICLLTPEQIKIPSIQFSVCNKVIETLLREKKQLSGEIFLKPWQRISGKDLKTDGLY